MSQLWTYCVVRRQRRPRWLVIALTVIVQLALWIAAVESKVTMDDITFRGLPSCLPSSRALSYGWIPQADEVGVQRKTYPVLSLEYSAWTSSNLTTYAVAYLLRDVMGIPIRMAESSGQTHTYDRVAAGLTQIYTEIWPLTQAAQFRQYIIEEAKIDYMGLLGYAGRIALYFPRFIIDSHPGTIFTSWRSLLQPDVLQYLPLQGTTPTERLALGEFMCTKRYCTNGIYVPPQCMPNGAWFGQCRELWHVTPDYSIGVNEQRIIDLGLPLVVVYLGSRFLPLVEQCLQRQDPTRTCLFFYWTPETLIGMYPVERVNFDPPRPGSWASWNNALAVGPEVKLTVDWDTDLLHKIAHKSVRETVPPAWSLFRSVTFSDGDILQMLASVSSTDNIDLTACEWVKKNEAAWKAWIPPPPPDLVKRYLALLPPNRLSIGLHVLFALMFIQIVITSLALYLFRRDAKVRIQSPILLSIVLAGAVTQSTAVMLKQWLPSSCGASVHLIGLGWSLIQVAILLKCWRTYYIFFNMRLSTVVFGRLFTLKVTTKHLLGTGIVCVVVLMVVMVVKFALSPLMAEVRALNATQFTISCTTRLTILGAIGELSWILLQLTIAGACLWMSHRTKGVVSLYNEHRPVTYATICQLTIVAAMAFSVVLSDSVDPHLIVAVITILVLAGSIGSVAVLATTTVVPISAWSSAREVLSALARGDVQQMRVHTQSMRQGFSQAGGAGGASSAGKLQQGRSHGAGGGGGAPGAITIMLDQTGSMSADLDDRSADDASRAGGTSIGATSGTGLVVGSIIPRSPTVTGRLGPNVDCAGFFTPEELRAMSAMAVPLSGTLSSLKPKELLIARVVVHVLGDVSMRLLPRSRWTLQRPQWLPVKLVTFADLPLFLALPVVTKSARLNETDCQGIVHRAANNKVRMALTDVSGDPAMCPVPNTGAAFLQLERKTAAMPQSPQAERQQSVKNAKAKAKEDGIETWLIHANDAATIGSWIAAIASAFGHGPHRHQTRNPNSRTKAGGGKVAKSNPVKRPPSSLSTTDPKSPLLLQTYASLKQGSQS